MVHNPVRSTLQPVTEIGGRAKINRPRQMVKSGITGLMSIDLLILMMPGLRKNSMNTANVPELSFTHLISLLPEPLRPIAELTRETLCSPSTANDFIAHIGTIMNGVTGQPYMAFSVSQSKFKECARCVSVVMEGDNIVVVVFFNDGAAPAAYQAASSTMSSETVVNLIHKMLIPAKNVA